jgi:hypothetical protein
MVAVVALAWKTDGQVERDRAHDEPGAVGCKMAGGHGYEGAVLEVGDDLFNDRVGAD